MIFVLPIKKAINLKYEGSMLLKCYCSEEHVVSTQSS